MMKDSPEGQTHHHADSCNDGKGHPIGPNKSPSPFFGIVNYCPMLTFLKRAFCSHVFSNITPKENKPLGINAWHCRKCGYVAVLFEEGKSTWTMTTTPKKRGKKVK